MPSDFMEQFRAGFQMGQSRNENARRDADLQMEQERQWALQQQAMERARREQEAHALNVETQKVNLAKAKLDAKIAARSAAESFGAEQGMEQMQASTAPGGQFTRPGAAPIPGMGELAGPPAEGVPTQPAMTNLPAIEEVGVPAQQRSGIDMLKALVARQQEAQQAKVRDTVGLKVAEAEAMQPFEEAKFNREAGLKRELAGQRTKQMQALLGSFGTAKTEGQQNKVEVAQYGLAQMPKWQKFINDNTDKFGFYAGRATKIKQSGALEPFGVKADKGTADFTSSLGVVRNAMLNALSGAAISPQEYERMKDQIPLLEDPPDVVKAKMATLDDYFKFRLKNFNAPYQGPGWEQEPPPPAALAAPPKGGMGNSLGTWYGIEILSGGDE